ncbi:unnamed protein product [Lota lota]
MDGAGAEREAFYRSGFDSPMTATAQWVTSRVETFFSLSLSLPTVTWPTSRRDSWSLKAKEDLHSPCQYLLFTDVIHPRLKAHQTFYTVHLDSVPYVPPPPPHIHGFPSVMTAV